MWLPRKFKKFKCGGGGKIIPLPLVRVRISENIDPFANSVKNTAIVILYVNFCVESENRCWQF